VLDDWVAIYLTHQPQLLRPSHKEGTVEHNGHDLGGLFGGSRGGLRPSERYHFADTVVDFGCNDRFVPILCKLPPGSALGLLYFLAPFPRPPLPSEKTYITTHPSSTTTSPKPLPCWHDDWLSHRTDAEKLGDFSEKHTGTINEPEVEMSVVIPAYNEEERLEIMLEEAVAFLDAEYGRTSVSANKGKSNGSAKGGDSKIGGYEILIVNDGSKDKTVDVALEFSRKNNLHDVLRICTLKENRGKGGAVTHGLRHVRGAYAVFADADGASKFEDLAKLVKGCKEVEDGSKRSVAVGSRAHLVGSEAVVKVRNSISRRY
jgi:dolichyl-phosphate beta-glucosyltransferase